MAEIQSNDPEFGPVKNLERLIETSKARFEQYVELTDKRLTALEEAAKKALEGAAKKGH